MRLTDQWFTALAEDEKDRTVVICGRDNIETFKDSGKFKERVEVTWSYDGDAMPDDATARKMDTVGEALRHAAEKDKLAILTALYTGSGKRIWVFYTRHTGAFGEMLNKALEPFELLPITVYSEKDPKWSDYCDIYQMKVYSDTEDEE